MYTFYLFLYNYLLKPAFKELQANLLTVSSRLACFQLHTFILCSPSSLLKSQLCLLYIRPLCSHSRSCKLYFPYILGWGMLGRAGHQKDQTLIRCLEFSVSPPPPFSREGRRAGDKVSDQSCLGDEVPIKITKLQDLEGFWVAEHMVVMGEHYAQTRGSPRPFPTPCPGHLLHLAVSDLDPFITNWWSSKCNGSLSFVSCSNKWIEPERGGSLGKTWSRASESEAQGTTSTCVWKWSWRGVSGVMEPLTCGIRCFLQADSSELS